MSGLGTQCDGNHYTSMKMQPVELAYRLYGTPCFCKLAKYLTRDKGDKLINLQKARHCITLEQDLSKYAMAYFDHLDFQSTTEAKRVIEEFTDILCYQEALFCMWVGDYKAAITWVDKVIQEFE
jgi:hypothetical protein